MKKFLLAFLFAMLSVLSTQAQTHTFPATDTNNNFTGSNNFLGSLNYFLDTGTANNYAITTSPPISVLSPGYQVTFKALHNNSGASTFQVNSITAVPITKFGTFSALTGGEITAGQYITVIYDGMQFQLQGQTTSSSVGVQNPLGNFVTVGNPLSTYNSTNGVFNVANYYFASAFSGTDPAVQTNECAAAAASVDGICDATMFGSFTGTSTTGITAGTTGGAHGKLLLPSAGHWNFTLTGGTACLLDIYPDFAVISDSVQNSFTINNTSAAGGAYCGVRAHALGLSGGDYYDIEGIELAQGSSAQGYASGISWWNQGGQDNSRFINDLSIDASATDAYNVLISVGATGLNGAWVTNNTGSPCCGQYYEAFGANSFGTGPVPMAIIGSFASSTVEPNGITLNNMSLTHPKAGQPNFLCQELGSNHLVSVNAIGSWYMEGPTSTDLTTQNILIDGCAVFNFGTIDAKENHSGGGSATRPVVHITTTNPNTSVAISGLSAINGAGAWQFPNTNCILNDNDPTNPYPCTANGVAIAYNSANLGIENAHILNSIRTDGYMRWYPNGTDAINTQVSETDAGSVGQAQWNVNPGPTTGQNAGINFFRSTNTTGNVSFVLYNGDNTGTIDTQFTHSLFSYIKGNGVGHLSIGSTNDCGNLFCVGTSTQLTVNSAGKLAANGGLAVPFNGAASTSPFSLTGTLFTGGTGTTTQPFMAYLSPGASVVSTWNTNGTVFGINAPASYTGYYFDFHINGGPSKASLDSAGNLIVNSCSGCGSGNSAAPGFSTQYANAAATAFTSASGINSLANGVDSTTSPTVQTVAESERVCGPSPSNDATCYGAKARPTIQSTTASGTGTTLTLASAIDLVPGDVIDVDAGGAATTILTAPAAPTVTSPWQTGSTTIHAQCVAVDAALGLKPGAVTTFSGAPTQTQQNLSPSAATRTTNVITLTVANNYIAAPATAPTIAVLSGFVPADLNGEFTLASANSTTVTMNTGIWVASTETATTIGTITVYPYVDIQCPTFLNTDPTTQYAVYDDISGAMHFVGMTLPTLQTEVKDWGVTIEPVSGLVPPSFIPSTPPGAAVNQVAQTKITSLVGTAAVVSPALTNPVTSQAVMHDDGVAILAAATASRVTDGGSVTLPPTFNGSSTFGFYQVNFPFTFPVQVHLEIGATLVDNSTITMAGGNIVEGMSGATNQSFPQFSFRSAPLVTGTGSPMFLFPSIGNTYNNLTTILKSNAQNGIVFTASSTSGAEQSTLRDDNFTDQGSTNGSIDQAVVFQGSLTGINIENTQFTMGGYILGPGKLGPPVGGLVFRSEPNCTGCSNGIPNSIEMFGINSFATRGIMLDNSNQGSASEQNYRFSLQEVQNSTMPIVSFYGTSFASDIHLKTAIMDSSQANAFGNWSIGLRDVWLDHPTTSGGANVVTGLPISGLHADMYVSTPLGQNYDDMWTQVNTSRMGPSSLFSPDTVGIQYQYSPLALPETGVGQSNIPIFVKFPAPVITVSAITGTWPAGIYSITRDVVGPNSGTSRQSAPVSITLNGSQGIQVVCSNCPITGAYGYFDYHESRALSTNPVITNTTSYAGILTGHQSGQGDGSGYPLFDATGLYTPQASIAQLNTGSGITASNWSGRTSLVGGTKAITFTTAYINTPVCIGKDATTPTNTVTETESPTGVTFTGTGTDSVKYICVGNPN